MKRVVIVGGGVSGLVAAHIFEQNGANVTIVEGGKLGGDYLVGGLKYIHRTDEMTSMLNGLGQAYSNYNVRGGIHLHGEVKPYPKCLDDMTPDQSKRIQDDHYRKTRRSGIAGDWSKRSMNDPMTSKARNALHCDHVELIKALAKGKNVYAAFATRILLDEVGTIHGRIPFDYMVLTVPLWIIRQIAPASWKVPEGAAMNLNVVSVRAKRDKYAKWDYVYTPYTPGDSVHRFSPASNDYSVEVNGQLDRLALESDLQYIFDEGYWITDIKQGLKGHLLPLPTEPMWPENVAPIGRFAKWDPRSTMDVALDDAIVLAKRWL